MRYHKSYLVDDTIADLFFKSQYFTYLRKRDDNGDTDRESDNDRMRDFFDDAAKTEEA